MEIKNFGYSSKHSAVASAVIISPASETEQELGQFLGDTAITPCLRVFRSIGTKSVFKPLLDASNPHDFVAVTVAL